MRKVIIIIFLIYSCCISVFGDNINFSRIGLENGLSQSSVMVIHQDELGAMWFGTREGLNRYYGGKTQVFKPQPNDSNSLSHHIINGICGNGNGQIYILTHGGLDEFDLRTNMLKRITFFSQKIQAITYGANKLWIAENRSIYTYENGKYVPFYQFGDKDLEIKIITVTTDKNIIVGTLASGVFLIDKNHKSKQLIASSSQVSRIFEDSKKNIWIATWENGLYRIDKNGNIDNFRNENKQISSNFVRAICEDDEGNIWVGTKKGLDKFYPEEHSFIAYDSDEYTASRLSNESIWYLFKDVQGTIWVGTYFGGVNYFNSNVLPYTYHDLQKGKFINKPFLVISSIIEKEPHKLFLSTEGEGLVYYDTESQTYINYRSDENDPATLASDNIKAAYYDKPSETLWLGTHLEGLCKFDVEAKTFKRIKNSYLEDKESNIIRAITPYKNNFLVTTYNGLFLLDKKTETLSPFSEKLHETTRYFVDVKVDDKNNLWLGGNDLYYYDLTNEKIISFLHNPQDSTSKSYPDVERILIDSKKRVWIGTNGGGVNLYIPESKSFKRYTTANSDLNNDFVSNIIESNFGYILITTTQGLSILDPETEKIINYDRENGFPLKSLFNGGIYLTQRGELFVAGMNNMISFYEENLITPQPQPSFDIYLMNMWVNNELIQPNDKFGILKESLPYTRSIALSYKQSTLQFELASNNYYTASYPKYRYLLKSSSNGTWTNLPYENKTLNFSNLSPGKYNLIVEAISPVDTSVIARTELDILMHPPLYLSWYAYIFYILVIGFIVWRYIEFTHSKLLLKASLDYEMKEKEQLENINQSKLRFFTNISHEFRTPLTLITSQVDMMLQSHNIPPATYNRILSVKRQTLNMQRLINDLLEFRKSEQGHLKIHAMNLNLSKFMNEVYISFLEYAKYRDIKFKLECTEEKIMLWFDPKEIQKVFYNLISNAFKFTPKGGTISIVVEEFAELVSISVIDSGVGISKESINKIFDRFYHAENSLQINEMVPGTGIGLALTKNILDLHQAKISVESQPEVGSKFVVHLKKGSAHFTQEQKVESMEFELDWMNNLINNLDNEFMQEIIKTQVVDNAPNYSMLIVEDNTELRNMLVQIFSPIYKTYVACDGEEGLEMTIEKQPDIVISDLMMPKMSGSEMCTKIKSNFNVCHIPVVLITAQTAMEYKIESLGLGADDYITKPFDIKTLILRCNNLVNNRRVLQEKFSKQAEFSPQLVATNEMDRVFIEKAHEIVEKNLDNPGFDITFLSNELALGRTKMFSKIKGITGQTPNQFILTIKMKKAAVLLCNHPEYNISDITYMLSFNTPKYFTKCFKEHFGVSPSEYRKSNNE